MTGLASAGVSRPMEKALLVKSIFFFISIWGIANILLWFRPRIELFWKLVATVIFGFYLWFFWGEIVTGYAAVSLNWYTVTLDFIKELISLIFVNLFFLWPVVLVVVFYKADEIGAERLLKFMCIITLILWIIFVVYIYFDQGIDRFLYKNLKDVLPDAK